MSEDRAVAEATGIGMERWGMTEASTLGVLARIARHRKVELRVVALAVIAAAVARRARH
jgi:AmiR/NasT family two-component response regulator